MTEYLGDVVRKSWIERLIESIKGVLIGLLLFVVSFGILFWNEGRAIKRQRDIENTQGQCITVDASKVDAANDKKVVYLTGEAKTQQVMLTDSLTGLSQHGLALSRKVEMYQWKEEKHTKTEKKLGGGTEEKTSYTYKEVWGDPKPKKFANASPPPEKKNPKALAFDSAPVQTVNDGKLGAYSISGNQIKELQGWQPIVPATAAPTTQAADPKAMAKMGPELQQYKSKMQVSGNSLYIGVDPGNPAIGDIRIRVESLPEQTMSIVAEQAAGGVLVPHIGPNGSPVEIVQSGVQTAQQLFKKELDANVKMTWILRLVGVIAMWIGLMMILSPLQVLADVVPFIGNLIGGGLAIGAAIVSIGLSLITISIGWIAYRPVIGVPLLAAALAAIGFLVFRNVQRRKAKLGMPAGEMAVAAVAAAPAPLPPLPTPVAPAAPRSHIIGRK